MKLSYVDEDGDRVMVLCSADFDEAVRYFSGIGQSVVKLDIFAAKVAPSPPSPKELIVPSVQKEGDEAAPQDADFLLIEALQKKLEAGLRELQSISRLLDLHGVKSPALSPSIQFTPRQLELEKDDEDEGNGVTEEPEPVSVIDSPENSSPKVTFLDVIPSEDDPAVVNVSKDASKIIVHDCVDSASPVPVSTHVLSNTVSQQCKALFDESCAKTAEQTARQAEISQVESKGVVDLVQSATDKLLEQQERDRKENEKQLKRARELADEVQRICTALSKETADSCDAITRVVAEMVRSMK